MPHKTSEVGLICVSTVHIDIGNIVSAGLLEAEVKLSASLWCKLIWAVLIQVMLKAFLPCAAAAVSFGCDTENLLPEHHLLLAFVLLSSDTAD